MLVTLSFEQIYQRCDLAELDFADTAELNQLTRPLGQERALDAIEFGVDIKHSGFNVFALGPPGVGKHELVNSILASRDNNHCPQFDWCYVNNFDDPQKPLLLKLEAGMGAGFSKDMLQLVEDILISLPSAFLNEEYRNQLREIEEAMNERYEQAFSQLSADAKEQNVVLLRTPAGFSLAPTDGEDIISPEKYADLEPAERERIEKNIAKLQLELQKVVSQLPMLKREASREIQSLNKGITRLTVEQFVDSLKAEYRDYVAIIDYLQAASDFAIENAEVFLPQDDAVEVANVKQKAMAFIPFRVNVLVSNTPGDQVPLIFEDNPTYQNLIGRVENISEMGNLVTDLTLIRAGALHRANGGYLVLDARKLLSHMYAWEGLKRALMSGEVKISSIQEALSLGSTLSLEPECVPIEVKVILLGEPFLYYLLQEYDPDFTKLFNVAAEFSASTERNPENLQLYAQQIATIQQREGIRPIEKNAVGRLIEHASRLLEDGARLSLELEQMSELIKEADYWATKRNSKVIAIEDIENTITSQRHRHDHIRERLQQQILRDIKLIDTDGSKPAQVNGLSVLQLGNHAFGTPTRITATARLGSGKLIDIERESRLGGDIHSKGVMIISAYLAGKYAREQPLPLSASLVFEQSYGGIDGDSASCAEVCVLLSAIGDIPLRQDLAVTGSMNQLGEVQAIGGVNHKVEGFFNICAERGLTGRQGVILPAANQVHLMLNADVRDAVKAGRFHLYVANHVEDVMAKLTGMQPGKLGKKGQFRKGSFNRRISDRIDALLQLQRKFSNSAEGDAKS